MTEGTAAYLIAKILEGKVRLVTVDVDKEFIHFDKMPNQQWRVTLTKKLVKED